MLTNKQAVVKWGIFVLVSLFTIATTYFFLSRTRFVDLGAIQKRDTKMLDSFDERHAYTQEFISTKPFLSQVEVPFLSLGYPQLTAFEIVVHLQDGTRKDIAVQKYVIPKSTEEFKIILFLKPQINSLNMKYYLLIRTNAPAGVIFPLGSEYDAYPNGELFVDTNSVKGDLSFFTFYRPSPKYLIVETFQKSSSRFVSILLISLAFWTLGFLVTSNYSHLENSIEFILLPFVVGIAIPPIAIFLISLIGINLTTQNLITIGLLFFALCISRKLFAIKKEDKQEFRFNFFSKELLVLSTLFVLAMFTRLSQINHLIVPSGIGGLTHIKILEKLVGAEKIPVDSIYHIGFHTNAFLVQKLLENDLSESTLIYGQWLSIVSGLSFYLLSRKLLNQPLYALLSTSIYWFLSPIPSQLVNWGRYPLLQGLTIIPVVLLSFWSGQKYISSNKLIISCVLGGLLLSHYGTFSIFVVLLLIFVLGTILSHEIEISKVVRMLNFMVGVLIPVILVVGIKSYLIIPKTELVKFIAQDHIVYTYDTYKYFFSHTLKNGGILLWVTGLLGYVFLVVRNNKLLILSIIWGALLLLLDAGQIFVFNHSATRPVNVLYFVFIPLSIMAGFAFKVLFNRLRLATSVLMAAFILAGSYNIVSVIDPQFVFYTAADQITVDWIKSNTPQDGKFLVSSYPYDGKYVPEDGGGWLPYLAGRKIYFVDSATDLQDPKSIMREAGIDYIYIGSGYGELSTSIINQSDYNLIYSRAGRLIYALKK